MERVPSEPRVLDTTVLSNFSYIERIELLADITGSCTVPIVRDELDSGVHKHSYLSAAVDALDEDIPVVPISESVANREAVVRGHLDPGEAQALALAAVHDGRLVTDDGDARTFAREQDVPVVGSVGVLLAAVDAENIDETTADAWLKTWIDETGFRVPYRDISAYRRL